MKAVLFDCDGVLLDSEPIYLFCVSEYLERLGRKASPEELAGLVGADIQAITRRLREDYELWEYDISELIRGQRELFNQVFYSTSLRPMDGLIELLQSLRKEGIACAVVSSSSENYVKYVLESLKIESFFETYVGCGAAARAKPFPDLYQEAMRRIQAVPDECAVIEDSSNGIQAGLDAGCYVVAYQGGGIKQEVSGAHETIADYRQLKLDGLMERMADWKKKR